MTALQIQNFKNKVDEGRGMVNFPGYVSCFLDKRRAMQFAWEDASTGHQKVMIHYKWNHTFNAYFLDAGAYDHEQEVLLIAQYIEIESVKEIKEDQ